MRIQLKGDVTANFLNVDQSLAVKSPRPGHSSVTAILPSFEGYIQSTSITNTRDILYV